MYRIEINEDAATHFNVTVERLIELARHGKLWDARREGVRWYVPTCARIPEGLTKGHEYRR